MVKILFHAIILQAVKHFVHLLCQQQWIFRRMSFGQDSGGNILSMTLTDSTTQYASALYYFKQWLSDNRPDLRDEGNDILPLIHASDNIL